MSPKRPAPLKPPPAAEELTDEWGIYDPEKAGIPALFKRLGRPVLRAAPTSARRDRRRGLRPERSSEGVGLALQEVRRRAGLLPDEEPPRVAGNPARAMRYALKARVAADQAAAAPFVPGPVEPEAAPVAEAHETRPAATAVVVADAPAAPPARKRGRKSVAVESAAPVAETAPAPVPVGVATAPVAQRPRGRKVAARVRGRSATAPAPAAASAPAAVESRTRAAVEPEVTPPVGAPVKAAPVVKAGPPAPSPRRPRGPVPLAAWAHAAADTLQPAVRRADPRGFWRGLFRIPAEVALVEYAHGCRIHRLLVEAGDDHVPDFI